VCFGLRRQGRPYLYCSNLYCTRSAWILQYVQHILFLYVLIRNVMWGGWALLETNFDVVFSCNLRVAGRSVYRARSRFSPGDSVGALVHSIRGKENEARTNFIEQAASTLTRRKGRLGILMSSLADCRSFDCPNISSYSFRCEGKCSPVSVQAKCKSKFTKHRSHNVKVYHSMFSRRGNVVGRMAAPRPPAREAWRVQGRHPRKDGTRCDGPGSSPICSEHRA
jgi:hypothetical protein